MKKIILFIVFTAFITLSYVVSLRLWDSVYSEQSLPILKTSHKSTGSSTTPIVTDTLPSQPGQTENKPVSPSVPDQTSPSLPPPLTLSGSTFKAISFNKTPIISTPYPTLSFNTDGTLSARFCNSIGGEYTDTYGILTAPHLIQTLMYCIQPDNLMDMETSFVTLLQNGASYERNGNILTIQKNNIELVFESI